MEPSTDSKHEQQNQLNHGIHSIVKSASRKRPLDEELKDTSLEEHDAKMPAQSSIQRLSLEAIFHPKFENENTSTQEIRKIMKQKILTNQGYLEVSLKHSGTLLLWSGGQRYYSKNSTGNTYTAVGEVLLRQHYSRMGGDYQACSDFITKQRLTLAFECVTSVLGHHGDLPHRDFLILTAVAVRNQHRFYTTVEILQLAQRFKLPHNDVWVYATTQSVDQLFHIYDTTRETGLAKDTIAALDASADEHVSSIYPHVEFQGDILEGIVIRYVANPGGNDLKYLWGELVRISQKTLVDIPPSTPASFETQQESAVLGTDLRRLYQECIDKGGYDDLTSQLGVAVSNILLESDGTRRKIEKAMKNEWDIPKLAKQLLFNGDVNEETRRIATAIVNTDQLKARVDYGVFFENDNRWLCMIHIIHDKTFRKYQKQMKCNDMHLYRGFCVELRTDIEAQDEEDFTTNLDFNVEASNEDAKLMLKMKFLPYMVRTFCCRNGLKYIENMGRDSFLNFTTKMMNQWGISQAAQLHWQPFFEEWGTYANNCFKGLSNEYINPKLPPLTENCYLHHLQNFIPVYEERRVERQINDPSKYAQSTYRALVIVVALTVDDSERVADHIAVKLGGIRHVKDINAITSEDLVRMKATQGGGLVCSTVLETGKKSKHLTTCLDSISVVIYGCEDEIITSKWRDEKRKAKELLGKRRTWRVLQCGYVAEVANCSNLEASDDFSTLLSKLKQVSDAVPRNDNREGILVFFPGIPGSGKSTICNVCVMTKLKEQCSSPENSGLGERHVLLHTGDDFGKKVNFWNHIKENRMLNSSSICIADKNAPPSAWGTVGDAICRGAAIPVLPDGHAIATTTIKGERYPNGTTDSTATQTYPFSLAYLAVCMARVLGRPPDSHAGKLDSALPNVCMIVVKFFCFYRNIDAEDFLLDIRMRIGASSSLSHIRVPFFQSDVSLDLPDDLEHALIDAIQLQNRYDSQKKKANPKNEDVLEAEAKLRMSLEKYRDWLLSLTCKADISQQEFLRQVTEYSKGLDTEQFETSEDSTAGELSPFVKVVSLDIVNMDVHSLIKNHAVELSSFLLTALGDNVLPEEGKFLGCDFIPNTHVTIVHNAEIPQSTIHKVYDHLAGKEADVMVLGLLWNDRVAALAVEVASETTEGIPFPCAAKEFTHITIWCHKGASPVESNFLPKLTEDGLAHRVDFKSGSTLRGKVSFWSKKMTSFTPT